MGKKKTVSQKPQSFEPSQMVDKKAKKEKKKIGKEDKLSKKSKKQKPQKMKANSIFKIIPEGMDDDQQDNFAALGYGDEEEIEMDEQIDEQNYQEQMEGQNEFDGGYDEEGEENEEFYGEVDENGEMYENGEGDENEEQMEGNEQEGEGEGQMKIEIDDEDDQVDLSVIKMRIEQTIAVLGNLARLGEGNSRQHFITKLKKYIHKYYGYNFQLIDHFLHFLNPTQMIQFLEANETQRPLTIRTNTLKTRRKQLAQALIQRGVNLDPLAEWSTVGIKIYDTKVPIGATPEYLAGHYMLQSASSFLPVLALDPQMNEKVLDMAAAPGGKTTYIAQLMKGTGSIFANDLKKDRLRALQFNLYRLGITNTVVTCRDGRKYPQIFPNTFDKVLLDSPCTGLGIISKDSSIKANRVQIDIYKNSHIQKQLILAAIDCVKVGGTVVYSTCSVSPLQNEQVVNYALKRRFVKVVDMDDLVPVGEEGLVKFIDKRYSSSLKKTRRIYPHVHNMDGFYVAKLVKLQNGKVEKEGEKVEQ